MSGDSPPTTSVSSPPSTEETPPLHGVVGIGGSAGALDGYERFFLALPPVTGMAFVVVPHLEPDHRGLMPDILARCTPMSVLQIEEGMRLLADHVYVIPPGQRLTLTQGILHLHGPEHATGMVIDTFFESLAGDQREHAVAVVLSGMGRDGTQGLHAIKANGGRVLVQDPQTAEYSSMPSSAAASQLADEVLSVEDLALRLLSAVHLARLLDAQQLTRADEAAPSPLQRILRLVRAQTGHDFTRYKPTTLVRRLERRMQTQRLLDVERYIQLLESSSSEVEALFQDFTINVTSFFRDTEAFAALKSQLRSAMAKPRQEGDTFRVWVAACSTGEEAYSVAILLHELAEEVGGPPPLKIQIFATDIDQAAIHQARQGRYSKDIAYVVSLERLNRFFLLKDGQYQIRADIRDRVVFATHNTFGDPPFTRLDLLCCRNMLIYVGPELQQQIISIFRYALRPHGLLFLGASETVGAGREHFEALSHRWKLYQRGEGAAELPRVSTQARWGDTDATPHRREGKPALQTVSSASELRQQVQEALLAEYPASAVLINAQGTILFVHGQTARYLELPPGMTGTRVFEMAKGEVRSELPGAVRQADSERQRIVRRGLQVEVEGSVRTLDLIVKPLPESDRFLVIFQDRGDSAEPLDSSERATHIRMLERELQHGREALQATVEDMAISMEEMRSTNDELQTTNEELQSTNEELMTSKEELQSLNEELSTINAEHQRVIQHLTQSNDDARNLLENAGTGTVFLGSDLKIRRFTRPISSIIQLMPSDEGRPLTDFNINLRYQHLMNDVRRVLETLEPLEAQVQTGSGEWYLMRVSPYRTSENYIEGVVMAFTNIDLIKSLE
ncbi:chemotaxis protein CheR [Deinococcus ruber]|uniref:protein-glutamate O-methyltransferase n=2 Tax=Deinococcus ruber TaxID=1848197 RepID=A0A918CBT1_9DEIO|nr:chemotaxis protein CheR [Deinococcus ruber]